MRHSSLLFLVLTALLSLSAGVSSAQWYQQNSGTSLRTTSGSSHWHLAQTGIRENVTSMSYVDAGHGWLVASGGDTPTSVVPQTSNGGKLALAKETHTADTFYLPDTVIAYEPYDTVRHTFTYNASGNMLTRLEEHWDGTPRWIGLLDTYTYDASGNVLTWLEKHWDGTQWVNRLRLTYTYDTNGNMLTRLREYWDGTQWVPGEPRSDNIIDRATWVYAPNGSVLTELGEQWDGTQWVNISRRTYTYDASGNLLTELYESWEGTQWVNRERWTYTYDASGNLLTDLLESRNDTQWVNWLCSTYTYDASENRLTWLELYWNDTQWANLSRYTYTYDVNGNMLTELGEQWNVAQWVIGRRYTYTYDASGNMLTWLEENLSCTQCVTIRHSYTYNTRGDISVYSEEAWSENAWVPFWGYLDFSIGENDYSFRGYQIILSYTEITTSVAAQQGCIAASYDLHQNYPNPFNPTTTIEYALPHAGYVTLRVYNMLGEEVATLVDGEHVAGLFKTEWDASSLPSGVYFYRLTAGEHDQIRKMVLMK